MSSSRQLTPEGLDGLDHALIAALSTAPELTNKALASRLGVAESTCAYRRRRLRDAGTIGPPRMDLDHAQLGYALQAVITVYMSSHSREAVDQFLDSMVTTPHVLQVVHLTGRADFMLTVAMRSAEELKNFVLDHITVHPAIRNTETHIVFDSRRGTWIPEAP
ncbi:Lrp/AsnC family transcriptional regulator [Nesterenkonia suensis]